VYRPRDVSIGIRWAGRDAVNRMGEYLHLELKAIERIIRLG